MSVSPAYKWLAGLCLLAVWSIASPQNTVQVSRGQFSNPKQPISESFDTYWSDERRIPLEIYSDRIGIQTRIGTTDEEVLEIAQALGLQLRESYYRGIYHFDTSTPMDRKSLNSLARQLQNQYPMAIKVAGLVVQAGYSEQPWLVADKIAVGFDRKRTDGEIKKLSELFSIADARFIPGCKACYVMSLSAIAREHVLEITGRLRQLPGVAYAHPSFVVPMMLLGPSGEIIDPALDQQWHHNNDGTEAANRDADIDSAEAWRITTGSTNAPLLAIVDSSFANEHPDLAGNVFGVQSFGTGEPTVVIDPPLVNNHGTSVAGIAGAVGGNDIGGKGVCPDCKLLLLRHDGNFDESTTEAICYAILNNADVISNSWAPGDVFDGTRTAIEEASEDHDIPVLFAMATDTYDDNCENLGAHDFSSLDENVIAVSSVTDQDQRPPSGYGNCADVLAPTAGGYKEIVTTNVFYGDVTTPLRYGTNLHFGGTSAATPMVTGTIGLMLDVSPDLSRHQIQRILQDTADKVDPVAGQYDAETGFSHPPDSTATHAYGRINAFEAVSLVAPFNDTDRMKRGHGGKDLLLRDHAFDWGNTINPSNELFTPSEPRVAVTIDQSVDIKVDVHPYQDKPNTLKGFLDLVSEQPLEGKSSRVYVRLRNRGPETIENAVLKLHWTIGNPLPPLQADFWTNFPNDPGGAIDPHSWTPLSEVELTDVEYSGASAASCPGRPAPDCPLPGDISGDLARVVVFDIPALHWNQLVGEKLSLLAIAHSSEDPVLAKLVSAAPGDLFDVRTAVAWDNNVSLLVSTTCCEPWIKILVIILVLVALALIVYVLVQLLNGNQIPAFMYVILIITLVILFLIWIRFPCCFKSLFG